MLKVFKIYKSIFRKCRIQESQIKPCSSLLAQLLNDVDENPEFAINFMVPKISSKPVCVNLTLKNNVRNIAFSSSSLKELFLSNAAKVRFFSISPSSHIGMVDRLTLTEI